MPSITSSSIRLIVQHSILLVALSKMSITCVFFIPAALMMPLFIDNFQGTTRTRYGISSISGLNYKEEAMALRDLLHSAWAR